MAIGDLGQRFVACNVALDVLERLGWSSRDWSDDELVLLGTVAGDRARRSSFLCAPRWHGFDPNYGADLVFIRKAVRLPSGHVYEYDVGPCRLATCGGSFDANGAPV